jgi:DNA/RNA endonuclease G (NUC1)
METVSNTIPSRLELARKLMAQEIDKALQAGADELMRRSSQQVPWDTGNLKDSADVRKIGPGQWAVVYNQNKKAPYAVEVHETNKNYKRGRKSKYLEDPFRDFVPKFVPFLRDKIAKMF